ncbi:MAG: radical SAM protein [Deltaproteobacteria bacterium]|nr:radical SAM protein [Deltaproteobacteria bacterium]
MKCSCGGPLATLARREILARQPGIDSVVRHAGEAALVALVERLAAGRVPDDVPGLTTRQGDGRPAIVGGGAHNGLRPLRPAVLPLFLGVPTARLLASRGCPGRCPYCGPAALQDEAVREGLAEGIALEELARRGVGGVLRRSAEDVADEVAELYHRRRARFFILLDDNLLAGEPGAAAAWLHDLRAGLRRRAVERTAWSLQLEARTVTTEVARELGELGAVRTLIGVEALTAGGLERLGRPADPAVGPAAIGRIMSTGSVVSVNLIAVHPGTDGATMRQELDALAGLRGGHFDALALAVHPGTRAWRALWHAGELSGGAYAWRHEIRDPAVGRFRSLLVRMRVQGMGPYGPNVLAHDVAVNAALARRLGRDPRTDERADVLRRLLDGMNERRIAVLRAALELSLAERTRTEFEAAERALVGRFRREMAPFIARFERLESELERAGRIDPGPRRLFFRSALAASFILIGGTTACYPSRGTEPRDGAEGTTSDGGEDAGADGADDASRADEAAVAEDGSADVVEAAAGGCSGVEERWAQEDRVCGTAADAGCPSDEYPDGGYRQYGLVTDSAGRVVDICVVDGDPAVPEEVRSCYLEALAGETFPCSAHQECWALCYVILM